MTPIGFIGLGNMGLPMAVNLVRASIDVYGLDINKEAEDVFKERGGKLAESIPFLTEKCNLIFTSLPNENAVRSIYFGNQGLIENGAAHNILIDTSTVSPSLNQEIEAATLAKGIPYLAAPVSGGVIGAINRTLTFMVGGEKEVFLKASPYMKEMGENIFHISREIDSGTITKLINNLLIGYYTAGVSEALLLAEKSGLNLKDLFEVLNVSYGQSRIYERNYVSFIAKENYKPGFALKLLIKDLNFALDLADQNKLELPISKYLLSIYQETDNEGYGNEDMAVLYKRMKNKSAAQIKGGIS